MSGTVKRLLICDLDELCFTLSDVTEMAECVLKINDLPTYAITTTLSLVWNERWSFID